MEEAHVTADLATVKVDGQTNQVITGPTVRVQLIWPEERGPKDDCRGGTKIVWDHSGDIKDYPAALWHLLAPHVDVWRLVQAKQPGPAGTERSRLDAQAARERGMQTGTETISTFTPLDEDQLASMSDEEVYDEGYRRGYKLHPRLSPANLRAKFLEQQSGV